MNIADVAYISRWLDTIPEVSGDYFELLKDAINDDVANTTKITVVSGYFGTNFILNLLQKVPTKQRRAQCRVLMILGYESDTELIFHQIKLQDFLRQIVGLGYRRQKVEIKLFKSMAPLHTKLYGFLRTTLPIWYVGSANLSGAIEGDRHELMLRITGRSEALESYVKALSEHPTSNVGASIQSFISDLTSFFANGCLLFRPTRHRKFTFDAFTISPADRKKISEQLGKDSNVPHSDPAAEGFGFDLLSVVGPVPNELVTKKKRKNKVSFRLYCIETVYGYWMPRQYAMKVEIDIADDKAKGRKHLEGLACSLSKISDDDIRAEFSKYYSSSISFFEKLGVIAKPRQDVEACLANFISVRRAWLQDEQWLERNSSPNILENMPNIWADENAKERFMTSVFEDVAAVLNSPDRKPCIYRKLKEGLKLGDNCTGDTVRQRLETAIKEKRITGAFWR